MNRLAKAAVTVVLVAAFGGALYFALRATNQAQIAAGQSPALSLPGMKAVQQVELTGLIALDVEQYLKDERVVKVLAENGIRLKATRIGSREMAARVVPGQVPDFFFPSGVVAANQVIDAAKKANIAVTQSAPVFTPMVVASWQPIATILEKNGMARQVQPKVYALDMGKLTAAMLARKRWRDLAEARAYDVNKAILVSTTDVRKSNSAAMYLALVSHAQNNGEVVSDRATAQAVSKKSAELFKRQGYQENYVNGNFDDYVSIGMGKTPMAFVYENQLVSYAIAKKGIGEGMVLMYPEPTIMNKVVFLSMNAKSRGLMELLGANEELQKIAVEYGFRVANSALFMQQVKPTGLAVEERLSQLIDPPAFELMTEMIDVVTREMAQ